MAGVGAGAAGKTAGGRERAAPDELLRVVDLEAEFRTARGRLRAVDGVSFGLRARETLAVVGESGSGKTATALAILRLLPDPPGRITGGRVLLRGRDIFDLPPERLAEVRGREIAMVFQEPFGALNPVLTVGEQVAEVVRLHGSRDRGAERRLTLEALAQAGVPAAEKRLGQYPHELSGGLRQRVVIAIALACGPSVLIADEPTTALDVTVQARLLDLLVYLQRRLGLAVLLITHDLGVVARVADRVAVMYAGRIVEEADVGAFFLRPAHPYSRGLLDAARLAKDPDGRLRVIEGSVPDPADLPPGCRFAARCDVLAGRARDRAAGGRLAPGRALPCADRPPPAVRVGPDHLVRCFVPGVTS